MTKYSILKLLKLNDVIRNHETTFSKRTGTQSKLDLKVSDQLYNLAIICIQTEIILKVSNKTQYSMFMLNIHTQQTFPKENMLATSPLARSILRRRHENCEYTIFPPNNYGCVEVHLANYALKLF